MHCCSGAGMQPEGLSRLRPAQHVRGLQPGRLLLLMAVAAMLKALVVRGRVWLSQHVPALQCHDCHVCRGHALAILWQLRAVFVTLAQPTET